MAALIACRGRRYDDNGDGSNGTAQARGVAVGVRKEFSETFGLATGNAADIEAVTNLLGRPRAGPRHRPIGQRPA
jgi:hypothetical protein